MKRIHLLSEEVINQIAAGEVVERPASVVKELVENSIDAGASRIDVEVSQGARSLRISDNGSGIHPADIKLAFSRHATSKIDNEQDLWNLHSLGFRGEALASILSISRLTCITRTPDAEDGIKVVKQDKGELNYTPTGCSVGTIFEIKDLFYNVPARLKFMKSPRAEVAVIVETLQNLAIANPGISFTCKHQNKTVLKTSGSGDLSLCLTEIFSKDLLNHLLMVNAIDEKQKYVATGVITDPSFTKAGRKSIYTIINNRFVKCPVIMKAIEKALEDKLPRGRFPVAIVNLMLPPEEVDVNVHPTKREVKYIQTNQIFGFIHYAISNALSEGEYYYKKSDSEKVKSDYLDATRDETILRQKETHQGEIETGHVPESLQEISIQHPRQDQQESAKEKPLSARPPGQEEESKMPAAEIKVIEEDTKQLILSEDLRQVDTHERKNWTVLGQAFNTYIIIEVPEGLQIIDQHIASERAIYDRLKKQAQSIAGQRLLIPEELYIDQDTLSMLEESKDHLESHGYDITLSEEGKVTITQVPQIVSGRNQRVIFEEIILLLEQYHSMDTIEDNILKTLSCHGAVRAGDVLSIKEMEGIIKQWKSCDYPYTCPHGRTISHTISLKELGGYFGRPVNYIGSI
jgi:DNA mismatch repair protein MutL